MHALPRGAAPAVVEQRREWIEALRWAKPAFRAAFEGGQAPTVTHLEDIAAVLGGAGPHDGDLPQSAATRLEDAAADLVAA